jgi:hypothetical protein
MPGIDKQTHVRRDGSLAALLLRAAAFSSGLRYARIAARLRGRANEAIVPGRILKMVSCMTHFLSVNEHSE